MGVLLLRRAATSLILVWLVQSTTFIAVRTAPGVPAVLLQSRSTAPQQQQALARVLGLDQGLGRQYLLWLAATLRGDWGSSFTHGRPVTSVLAAHLPATIFLGSSSLLVAFGVGVPLGVYCGRHAGSASDHFLRITSIALYSVPQFWLGLVAILALSYVVPLFPPGHLYSVGSESLPRWARSLDLLHHVLLPAAVLGLTMAAGVCRLVRNSVLEIHAQGHVRTARAKGLSERRVLLVHVLPSSLKSAVQIFGLLLPIAFGGVLITEVVFSWPGIGRLTHAAILARDYPLILGATALTASLVVLGNLLADILEIVSDPRLRSR